MFKFSDKPLSINEIFISGFALYGRSFSKVWYLVLINSAILNILGFLKSRLVPLKSAAAAAVTNLASVPPLSSSQMTGILLWNAIAVLAATFFFSALLIYLYNVSDEGQFSVKDACMKALRKFPVVAIVTIIIAILSFAGFILLFVPGIFVAVLLLMAIPLVVFAKAGIFNAVRGSVKLVWGNWWRSFIVILPAALVGLLVNLLLMPIALKSEVLFMVLNLVLNTFVCLLVPVYTVLLYHDLQLRKQ